MRISYIYIPSPSLTFPKSFPTSLCPKSLVSSLWNRQKTTHTHTRIWFVLVNYSSACHLPWCVIDMRNASPLKKTWFHSPSRYQLQVASWVRGGKSCLFPFLPAGILAGLSLYLSCTCCHSLCKFICSSILSCLDFTLSLESFITSRVYNQSISSTWTPEPWGKVCDIEISFAHQSLSFSTYCPVVKISFSPHLADS